MFRPGLGMQCVTPPSILLDFGSAFLKKYCDLFNLSIRLSRTAERINGIQHIFFSCNAGLDNCKIKYITRGVKCRRIKLTSIAAPNHVIQWIVEKPLLHRNKFETKFNTTLYKSNFNSVHEMIHKDERRTESLLVSRRSHLLVASSRRYNTPKCYAWFWICLSKKVLRSFQSVY